MNYTALIENRRSVREFADTEVRFDQLDILRRYYQHQVRRLIPELKTQLYFFGTDTRAALEGAAGYNQFLVGSPQYLVLMSEAHPQAGLNAGYIMEDLILKLTDMDLNSCWMTFTDSEMVKEALGIVSDLHVAAIAAFGYGKKSTRRLRLNFRSMSDVDIVAKHRYMEPKKGISQLVFRETWGNTHKVLDSIGFYEDMLWEAFYAASLSPSYLNRQAYGFLLHDGRITLVSTPDDYTPETDGSLSLGIVLLHFSAVAEKWGGKIKWQFGERAAKPELPEGYQAVASCIL
ncbi:MAG: nitroreductase family protein [Oscillospiraceae bacterium]|nr:nitroreductase family protein [Oscillospiraceae bacterium]